MTARTPRKDAARNRAAVLAAADDLFAHSDSPAAVTMADIATAAGVGKATLFRGFGDRTGLIQALFAARLEPIRAAVEHGPPPLGPATPAHRRIPALLDAVLCFKLDNRHLALALEDTGDAGPYRAEHYERWHHVLRDMLDRIEGLNGSAFAAHALLAATRADLVEHLVTRQGMAREELRADLARYTAQVIGARAPQS